jgi:hypothetical protein
VRNRPYPTDLSARLPALPPQETVNHTSALSFGTPARGDAYDFTISVSLCWCATGRIDREAMLEKIKARVPEANAEITEAVRSVARRFVPYRPDLAEEHIAAAVKSAVKSVLDTTRDDDGIQLTCAPRTAVAVTAEIRDMQRQYVAPEMSFEARCSLSKLAAERLGELRDTWRGFIEKGLSEWSTPYAISLALRYDEAAKILFAMREDRRREAEGLVDTIAQVASGHDRLDLLEFAVASDSALRKTYELLGIPLPEPAADSLFSAPPPITSGEGAP